ncbi:DUF4011 domain-containing protein [Janibacter corallicola]|uniref:DUF4011 domain-containing protein n=1 Tax=Janibacter corallicola TaxID=415212 RepID=UPI00083114F4|nr:DUF4011 domain-containing protein [Janibacter corallicola]
MTTPSSTPAQMPAALDSQRVELMELGGPNTLIWPAHDPDVLELTTAHPGGVAMLLAGHDARLSDLVREPSSLRRVQAMARRLTEHCDLIAEEHGVHTCFLAMGAASWPVSGEQERPLAPVLLRRCRLRRLRPGPDFALDFDERVEFNPALLTYLQRALRRTIDGEALVSLGRREGRGFNPAPVYAALEKECADLSGLTVTDRIAIGSFPYGKAEELADLARIIADEQAERHEIASALLTKQPIEPGEQAPSTADEAVLDLTSDQQLVLDRVAAGESIYVDAPPGTGAGRLIAATIAAQAGRGRRVLLVAEKHTALETAAHELAGAGLGELVLIVPDPTTEADPEEVVGRWQQSSAPGDDRTPGARAAAAATVLEGHTEALHEPRDPWGVSIAQAQDAVVSLGARRPAPRSRVRLRGSALAAMDEGGREAAAEQLASLARRRLWRPGRESAPWTGARLTGQDDVDEVLAAVERLRGREGALARLRTTMTEVFTGIAEPRATSPSEYGRFLAGIEQVRDTFEVFRPEIFDAPLEDMCAATDPGPDSARLGMLERRRLRGRARKLLRPGRPPEDLHAALARVAEQQRTWSTLTGGGGRPRVPTDIDAAHAAYEKVYADLTHVGSVIGFADGLLETGWERLEELLTDLAGDAAGARIVPDVIDDLDDLRGRGLGDLLEDLIRRQVPPESVADEVRFVWWTSVLEEAGRDERYSGVTGKQLDEALRSFADADRASMQVNATRIATEQRERFRKVGRRLRPLSRDVAAVHDGYLPGLPWSRALTSWEPLLTAAAPAWAMPPFVVGQVMPPEQEFDLVIVDDASRTTLARTLSAVVRGRQLLVIGDRGQLPPRTWTADAGVPAPAAPTESLADVAQQVLPGETLRDSASPRPRVTGLLAKGAGAAEVVHPPAPGPREDVRLRRVEGHGAPLDEETGLVESTPAEVGAVVAEVRRHLLEHPMHSLGVLTFGEHHAERITEALAELLRDEPELADAVEELAEALAIKPAARWQREQRDRMIISVGHGHTPDGRMVHRFGELSGPEGERLVLLAATRARHVATWVTTLNPGDLDGEWGHLPGHAALRTLLRALDRPTEEPEADEESLSPLLQGFVERLRAAGLVVGTNVGAGEYRIDIAVADPRDTSRWLVAVDVDGPGYAGLASTRQRDRILIERLLDLGWGHLRLWTTDIFADPARQEAEVHRAVRRAVDGEEGSP